MKLLRLEFYKIRRKRLLPMIVLFLLVELSWAFMSISISMARNPDTSSWETVLITVASMNGLFMPIITAVAASRICDMEHKGSTWKLMMSAAVKRNRIYGAKYICAALLMLLAVLVQAIAIVFFGTVYGLEQPLSLVLLLQFMVGTMLTTMVVLALQQWIALAIKNQAFALAVGMLGGFIGMTADLFPEAVRSFFVWSYYTGLSPVAYSYSGDTMRIVSRSIEAQLPLVLLAAGALCYVAGMIHVSRQDV